MYSRLTGSQEFYTLINETFPTLRYDLRLRALILYLMFPTWYDDATHKIVIEQSLIARIVNQEKELLTGDFSAKYWLDKIKALLPAFEHSSYDFNRARVIDTIEWPIEIQKGLDMMRTEYYNKTGDVFLLTGQKVNDRNKSSIRKEDEKYAVELEKKRQEKLQSMAQSGVKEADTILEMLNALSVNMFTRLLDGLDVVWSEALNMPEDTQEQITLKNTVLNILRAVAIQPKPFYKAVDKSVRLYTMNTSILRLPRKLRKLFIADLTTLDLRASQLTIVATDWNITWLKDFLANDGNAWSYFFNELGLDYSLKQTDVEQYEAIKAVLKHEGLYPIIYGRNENALLKSNRSEFIKARKAFQSIGITVEAFLNTRMMQEIVSARSRVYDNIRKNKGAHDIFGRWIALTKDTSVESIASQLTQSVELKLMYPIVELAFTTTQFDIVIWLHDSVSVKFDKKERAQYWIKRLQDTVKEHAGKLGYDITLDTE